MEKAAGVEPKEGMGVRVQLERELHKMKEAKKAKNDTDLSAEDLKKLIEIYKKKVKEVSVFFEKQIFLHKLLSWVKVMTLKIETRVDALLHNIRRKAQQKVKK